MPYELAQGLTQLGRMVLGEQSLTQALQEIARTAQETLVAADQSSVTVLDERLVTAGRPARARTVGFNGDLALDLDERQYHDGVGPSLDAATSGVTIMVDTAGPLYPQLCAAARRRGVGHVLALGLRIGQRPVGALTLYAGTSPFSPTDVALAEVFAEHAAVTVANAGLYADAIDRGDHLQVAMSSRAIIEQAKGIIMGQQHCDAAHAFNQLRRASQDGNRKLRDVAQDLIDRATASPA